nr:zinc finger, CCHC-type, retrotransposon Gag domain protein [Tanacetum cinerariifolium]
MIFIGHCSSFSSYFIQFILGLNALISKSLVHLRRRQLSWTRRIRFLIWRRSLMSWVVRMHSRLDWLSAGTEEEQAKNFQWGLRKSTLNHLMCMPFTDVAQVANAARNYEILYERDDDDTERPDKRQKSSDRHQTTSQQSSHRNHGHNDNRHGSDRRGGSDNHCSSNNNYSGNNNRNSGNGRDQRNRGQQSNRSANSGFQQSRGSSEGYSYSKDYKKNTTASTSGQADKKPGASGRVFAITEDHATKTSDHFRFASTYLTVSWL